MYNSVVGQAPYLHKWLFGNEIGFRLGSLIPQVRVMNSSRYIVSFAARQLERYNKQDFNTVPLKDMLDRFKRFKDEEQLIDDPAMLSHAVSNMYVFPILLRDRDSDTNLDLMIDLLDLIPPPHLFVQSFTTLVATDLPTTSFLPKSTLPMLKANCPTPSPLQKPRTSPTFKPS